MSELSPALQRPIEEAVATDPNGSAEDFMRDLGAALADGTTREAIRSAWLRAAVVMADSEGGELTGDEVFGPVRQRLKARIKADQA